MIDTLRILVDWKCNLKCSYCCNEQERFRKDIQSITSFSELNWDKYKFVCISGGEPLLFLDRVKEISKLSKGFNIIYSNGLLWNSKIAKNLESWNIKAANIGLHYPKSFNKIIENVNNAVVNSKISVRFHVWDKYQAEMISKYSNVTFKFWAMNDCNRINEERFVLIDE